MKKANSRPLSLGQKRELAALARLPDDRIDTRSIPEARNWSGAKRGVFYRPLKQQLTLRLDADVIAWFRDHAPKGEGYQTDINRALREHVRRQVREDGLIADAPRIGTARGTGARLWLAMQQAYDLHKVETAFGARDRAEVHGAA